jgi:hypothetical protein
MPSGSPQQIALLLRRKALQFEQAVRQAEKEAAAEALRIARELSSGPYSSAALRRMGHPYARRRPRPPGDVAIVNVQTGRFLAAWRVSGPRKTGSGLSTRLVNNSPQARLLLGGTKVMIARPIIKRIGERVAAKRRRLHQQAMRRALKG